MESTVNGYVDYKGNPAHRSNSGAWKSAFFIIVVEVAERFAFYGVSCNLITYLTGTLGQSTATAATNVNAWLGTAQLMPLLGGYVADSFLGRYRTLIFASVIYILGLCSLTVSAVLSSSTSNNLKTNKNMSSSSSRQPEVILFFYSIYVIAVGEGGHKPNIQAFGANQFDGEDPEERKAKSSFFNWSFFGVSFAGTVTVLVLTYIEDNLSWGLGFGIPCFAMSAGLCVFLLGTRNYRYSIKRHEKSPFARIGGVFIAAVRNWRTTTPSAIDIEEKYPGTPPHQSFEQYKFLNKALMSPDGSEEGKACTVSDVEDAKAVLRLVPIWVMSFAYAIVYAQCSTFFTKQGVTMDRKFFPGFKIPAASLQGFIGLAIFFFIPIYDFFFVPVARALTRKPSGITMLQRIGTGMLISVIAMVVSALVEIKRLKTAEEYGLVDMPNVTVPMSVWWLIPQYVLCGIGDVFTIVGLQEFFYDQVPNEIRSVGLALYLSILGVGSFLSSFLIYVIKKATVADGDSWFSDNLNRAHLDYFYWLLAGLSAVALASFLYFAKSYIYNR